MITRRYAMAMGGAFLFMGASSWAQQPYPARSIRIIVPFIAGGSADLLARKIAEQISNITGKAVVIENKGGASGAIAADLAKRANPDGYTLLLAHTTLMTILPILQDNLSYDPVRDFSPISLIAQTPQVLVTHPDRFNSLDQYLQAAQAAPGEINYATGGIATPPHLTGELLKLQTGIDFLHVPFNGAPAALAAVMGGHVDAAYANIDVLVERIRTGQLKGLAIASNTRSEQLPDVPTFEELGIKNIVNHTWFGLAAPAATPDPVLHRINEIVHAAISSPSFQEFLTSQAAEEVEAGPDYFSGFLNSEHERWRAVIQQAGIEGG